MEQVKLGLESGTPQLIWASPDLDLDRIEDDEYGEFLRNLEEGHRGDQNYEFVRASLVDFTTMVCERAAARATLEYHEGNKSRAARELGITRSRLYRILREDTETDA